MIHVITIALLVFLCLLSYFGNNKKKYCIHILSVGLALHFFGVFYQWLEDEKNTEILKQSGQNELIKFSTKLQLSLLNDTNIILGLSAYVETNPNINQKEFEHYSSIILGGRNHILNIGLAPDLIMKFVYPYESNKKVIGLDFNKNPIQKEAALKTIEKKDILIAGPIDLVQGGRAVVGRMPIFTGSGKTKKLWGLVSAPIAFEKLMDDAGIEELQKQWSLAIRGQDALGPQGQVFFGSPKLFDADARIFEMPLPVGSWQLAIRPKMGWGMAKTTNWYLWGFLWSTIALFFCIDQYRKIQQKKQFLLSKELFHSENIFKMMFTHAPVGIAQCHWDGTIIKTNQAYLNIIGYTATEIKQLTYWDITPREYEDQEMEQLGFLKITGHYGPYQKEYLHKNGHRRHVLLSGVLIEDKNQPTIWSFVSDITDQVINQTKLEKAKFEAEKANLAKSEFLANMSHEIRTPMNGILGFTELLEKFSLDDQQLEYVQHIHKSSLYLLQIINDILDISKFEATKMTMEKIPVSISILCKDLENMFQVHVQEKQISFNIVIDSELQQRPIISDPIRLKQLIVNLCSNAIKFTHKGYVQLNFKCLESSFIIEVSDTGIGLTPEQRSGIFEKFNQADTSTTRKFGGTGLGLSLCQFIAIAMNGHIDVQSEIGKGSIFKVTLPLLWSHEDFISEIEEIFPTRFIGTILLAEDNLVNKKLAKINLEKLGLKVILADNGKMAMECSALAHDLAIFDIQMPIMSGVDALKELRSKGYSKPTIAMTANVFESDIESYRQAGFDDFIPKPFTSANLRKVLSKYLPSSE